MASRSTRAKIASNISRKGSHELADGTKIKKNPFGKAVPAKRIKGASEAKASKKAAATKAANKASALKGASKFKEAMKSLNPKKKKVSALAMKALSKKKVPMKNIKKKAA